MEFNQTAPTHVQGALFGLDYDKPTADPLAELLMEILKAEDNYDRAQMIKTIAA